MSKEKIINIRIDVDLKKKAKRLADNDDRSLSNWIRRLIEAEVAKSEKRAQSKKSH